MASTPREASPESSSSSDCITVADVPWQTDPSIPPPEDSANKAQSTRSTPHISPKRPKQHNLPSALSTSSRPPGPQQVVSPSQALNGNPVTSSIRRRATRLRGLLPAQPAVDQLDRSGKSLEKAMEVASRSFSGETLVDDSSPGERSKKLLDDGVKALDMEWSLDDSAGETDEKEVDLKRRKSTRIGLLADAVLNRASSLGKRGREAFEAGKDKLQDMAHSSRSLRPRADDEENDEPPAKRFRVSQPTPPLPSKGLTSKSLPKTTAPPKKLWLTHGKYVGQDRNLDPRLKPAQLAKMKASIKEEDKPKENKSLPLPMYGGAYLLDRSDHRNFHLPFDIYSPLPPGQPRPDAWRTTQTNLFIGDASTEWKKTKPLPPSKCLCSPETGCDDDCQNRYMLYECDSSNCSVGPDCTNRAFADLRERVKRGRKYDIGIEIVKTREKGFGIRACRSFEPNQIIVEYTGEIITQEECERRMMEEYKDNQCYYLMMFDQNMIIDATRGSAARFINHSCEPNCRMIKWTVAGKPRMALFASDNGIMTGEELTYDYNFDPFSQKNVQECKCGAPSCRGVLGPRSKDPREGKKSSSEAAEPAKQRSKSASVVAGVKRKIAQVLNPSADSGNKASRQPTLLRKKRRLETDITAVIDGNPTRVVSTTSESTLIEKENVPKLSRSSSESPSSSTSSRAGRASSREASKATKPESKAESLVKAAAEGLRKSAAAARPTVKLVESMRGGTLNRGSMKQGTLNAWIRS